MASLSTKGGRVTERAILAALHQLGNATDPEAESAWGKLYSRMKEIADWQPPEQVDPPDRSIDADEQGNIFDRITFDVRSFPPDIEQLWTERTWPALCDILNSLPPADASETKATDAGIGSNPVEGEQAEGASEWLTVSDAAKASGCTSAQISGAVRDGQLQSNGEKGRKRRIKAADLALWQLRRAKREGVVESDATVEKKLRRAQDERRNYRPK
jgi:hypothetical protein